MELTQFDWLRIRAALLCTVEDLAKAGSDQEAQYAKTYAAVKVGLNAMYDTGLKWGNRNTITTTTTTKKSAEQLQEDLLTLLDGQPQALQNHACQIVVDNLRGH